MIRPWNLLLWGVEHDGHLIGGGWNNSLRVDALYPGMPRRALLFCTRKQARAWCAAQHAKYAKYPDGHIVRGWRFRPVRVRERVTPHPHKASER